MGAPRISVLVKQLGVNIGLSLGLLAPRPDVSLNWLPPLKDIEMDLTMEDLPPVLEPLNDLIRSSIMAPIRDRVKKELANTVTQELKKALGGVGAGDLFGA